MAYPEAAELATQSAESDSENFRRRLLFRPRGTGIGEPTDNAHLYKFTDETNKRTVP